MVSFLSYMQAPVTTSCFYTAVNLYPEKKNNMPGGSGGVHLHVSVCVSVCEYVWVSKGGAERGTIHEECHPAAKRAGLHQSGCLYEII